MTTKDYCDTCAHKACDKKAVECGTCMASYYDGVLQGSPSNYKAKQMTNADRIRAMSDEELAVFLAEEVPHGDCYGCELDCYHAEQGKFANMCQGAWYKWLKQEGDNNG